MKNILQINGDLEILNNETPRKLTNIIDLIYPVGSVIFTRDEKFNPNNVYGGHWVEWTDGYIRCTNRIFNTHEGPSENKRTKAEPIGNYYITEAQLPTHTHANTVTNNPVITDNAGTHLHYAAASYPDTAIFTAAADYNSKVSGDYSVPTSPAGAHTHTVTTNVTIQNVSAGQTEDYFPRYYSVKAWQRTG